MNTDAFLAKIKLLQDEIDRLKLELEETNAQLEKHVNKCLTCQDNHCLHHVNLMIGQGE